VVQAARHVRFCRALLHEADLRRFGRVCYRAAGGFVEWCRRHATSGLPSAVARAGRVIRLWS